MRGIFDIAASIGVVSEVVGAFSMGSLKMLSPILITAQDTILDTISDVAVKSNFAKTYSTIIRPINDTLSTLSAGTLSYLAYTSGKLQQFVENDDLELEMAEEAFDGELEPTSNASHSLPVVLSHGSNSLKTISAEELRLYLNDPETGGAFRSLLEGLISYYHTQMYYFQRISISPLVRTLQLDYPDEEFITAHILEVEMRVDSESSGQLQLHLYSPRRDPAIPEPAILKYNQTPSYEYDIFSTNILFLVIKTLKIFSYITPIIFLLIVQQGQLENFTLMELKFKEGKSYSIDILFATILKVLEQDGGFQ